MLFWAPLRVRFPVDEQYYARSTGLQVVSNLQARIVCLLDYEAVSESSISIFELLVTTYLSDLYIAYLL